MFLPPFKNDWITYIIHDRTFEYTFGEWGLAHVPGIIHAINQFKYIHEKTGKRVRITLSGGVDSQAVMYAALLSGVPFDVYSMRFQNDLNSHDLGEGLQLAEKFGIAINFVEIDIINFFTSGQYLKYIHGYTTSSPQIASFLWFIEQIHSDGVVLVASGNPIIRYNDEYEGMQNYTLMAWERMCRKHDFSMIGNFFWYSPELFGSLYYEHVDVVEETEEDRAIKQKYSGEFGGGNFVVSRPELPKPDFYRIKCDQYTNNGFEIIPQSKKQTGFEKVKEVFYGMYPKMQSPFDTLCRYPYESAYNKHVITHGLKKLNKYSN